MQRLLAITWLTWKAALRFRLFWVITTLLVGSVIILPIVIKDDGTARGFTQILLTYTLGTVTMLLGLCTLWLSCGTLARDIEENQMQLVAVKPIARWQIWLGKWLGLVTLNAALLAIAGICIVGLLQWRAQKLSPAQQRILREEVLVARGSLQEPSRNVDAEVERLFRERMKDSPVDEQRAAAVKQQLREVLKNDIVQPGYMRRFQIDLGLRKNSLRDEPLFARIKFYAASTNDLGTYYLHLDAGEPDTPRRQPIDKTFAANSFHEVRLAPNLWNAAGILTVDVQNRDQVALAFPIDEGFELLYREASFPLNFARGLLIVLCWLALLAAVGLAAASFLSFPVAVFLSVTLFIVGGSFGAFLESVRDRTFMPEDHEEVVVQLRPSNSLMAQVLNEAIELVDSFEQFEPIGLLSVGRAVGWGLVAKCFGLVTVLLGGICAAFGIAMFTRRELAAVHSSA